MPVIRSGNGGKDKMSEVGFVYLNWLVWLIIYFNRRPVFTVAVLLDNQLGVFKDNVACELNGRLL